MSGGVALVYPHFREHDPVEKEKLFPPLGIAGLAAQLRERAIPVSVHDCTFLSFNEAVQEIVAQEPRIVGIYTMITMSRHAFEMLRVLRTRIPLCLFLSGGPLPTLYPAQFAGAFDLVLRGECDTSLPLFCSDYLSVCISPADLPALPLGSYPGLYLRTGTSVIENPPVHNPATILGQLPLPDRSGFDHARYRKFWRDEYGYTITSILITRGCPYSCDFCSKPVWGSLFRTPPLDRVFSEIENIRRYGYERLWIADDSFTLDDAFLRGFCERMIRAGVPMEWHCLSRVDNITPGIAELMRQAGCRKVYLGLESGNDETLRMMGKRATVAEGIRAVRIFRDTEIGTCGFFIVGYPGESKESIRQTLGLVSSLPLDEVSVNVPFPLPGSPLFSRVSGLESTADWERANEIRFMYRSEFDEDWLKSEIGKALRQRTLNMGPEIRGGTDPVSLNRRGT